MKRVFLLSAMIVFVFSLSGCFEEEKKRVENIDKNVEALAKSDAQKTEEEKRALESHLEMGRPEVIQRELRPTKGMLGGTANQANEASK